MTSTSPDPAQPGGAPPPPSVTGPGVEPAPRSPAPGPSSSRVPARTRASSTYVAVAFGIAVLILLLIFIIQNLEDASVHFLGAHFRLPVGVLMLISGVAGAVIVLLVSLARVLQLRVQARRSHHDRADHPRHV